MMERFEELNDSYETLRNQYNELLNEKQELYNDNIKLRGEYHFLEIDYREAVDHMNFFLERVEILESALMKACKLLHKAGVVYGKKDGRPLRLSTNNWFDKLVEDAINENKID